MSKLRYVVGVTTTVGIIGFSIYAYKQYREQKKSEEESMSLEDAQAEVAARRQSGMDEAEEEFGEMVDEIRDHASWNRSFMPDPSDEIRWRSPLVSQVDVSDKIANCVIANDKINSASTNSYKFEGSYDNNGEEVSDIDEEDEDVSDSIFDDIDPDTPLSEIITEEDRELRYEPSSMDAINQYKYMELAEWAVVEDTHQTMMKLFEFPFEPMNDGDYDLKTKIIDYRVGFFGFGSKWTQMISYADVILHYARLADYNCGEGVKYWVEYFLDFNELESTTPSHHVDTILRRLNSHSYFNEERHTFGLFGLTRESMDQAIKIANRNVDSSVTYEIEFNEFLKSCI